MRMEQLKYFAEVAKAHSIAIASEKLFVTQPAISIAIKNLEEELGCVLFIRSKNGIQLTDMGTQLLESVESILKEERNIYHIIERSNRTEEDILCGDVTIEIAPVLLYSFLGNMIIQLLKVNDNLHITVNESVSSRVLDAVINGKSDIGFSILKEETVTPQLLEESELCMKKLYSEKMYVLAHKKYGLGRKKSLVFEDIDKLPFVVFAANKDEDLYMNKNVSNNIVLSTFNLDLLKDAVEEGIGITILNSSIVQNFSHNSDWDLVPLRNTNLGNLYYFFREDSPKRELLLRLEKELLKYCYV